MKKIHTLISSVVLSVAMSFSAFATPMTVQETAQSILAVDNHFYYDSDGVKYDIPMSDRYNTAAISKINALLTSALRGCAVGDFGSQINWCSSDGVTCSITIKKDELSILAAHQDVVDSWADATARAVIPSGTSRDEAILTSYLHIARNYSYNTNLSNDEVMAAQGAYFMIKNGYGLCASYAKVFRSLVEAIPFNQETGLVDWECTSPTHIKVVVAASDDHEWNEIQDADGVWYVYDLSASRSIQEALTLFHRTHEEINTLNNAAFYAGFNNNYLSY